MEPGATAQVLELLALHGASVGDLDPCVAPYNILAGLVCKREKNHTRYQHGRDVGLV